MSSINLKQELKNSLKLNVNLAQSIKTLQLSTIDLEEYLNDMLLENPFLSSEEADDDRPLYDRKISSKNYDIDYDSVLNLENEITLKEHIVRQLPYVLNDDEKIIGRYLTDYIDDNGYLKLDLQEASKLLKVPISKLEDILEKLQTLEPSGIFARTLAETLEIQLKEKGLFNTTHKIILANLEILARGELNKLCKLAKQNPEDVRAIIKDIKSLEPKPGRKFGISAVSVKIPDVHIIVDEGGKLKTYQPKKHSINLKTDKSYYENVIEKLQNKAEKDSVSELMQKAINIVKSVEMRGKTISRIAEAIAFEQEEFFKRGILYLKPLTLSKIAEATGYDESTISRATSNKYAATPFGVIEMKYFFSSGVKSKYSKEEVSSHKVKEIIKTIIADEDRSNPLSDEEIANMLRQFNIVAARRTVAKYRESLKIPPSSKRKKVSL